MPAAGTGRDECRPHVASANEERHIRYHGILTIPDAETGVSGSLFDSRELYTKARGRKELFVVEAVGGKQMKETTK